MLKINRTAIENIISLEPWKDNLVIYCQQCANGLREWQSSGNLYTFLKIELANLTQGHCSFCDGYPFSMSKQTIEHYFPKAQFKEKTYEWSNLFICCDKCQSNANRINPFQYTLKPDDEDYSFDEYFWFNAADGKVNVLENIDEAKQKNASNFLIRYGINSNPEVLSARQRLYQDLIVLIKNNPDRDRNLEPNRFIFDSVVEFINYKENNLL